MTEKEEQHIISLVIKNQDDQALRLLLKEVGVRIEVFLIKNQVFDQHHRREIIDKGCQTLLRNIREGNPSEYLAPYMWGVIKNKLHEYNRKKTRDFSRVKKLLDAAQQMSFRWLSPDNIDEKILLEQKYVLAENAVDLLDKDCRKRLKLLMEGKTHKELVKIFPNTDSIGVSKVQVFRCKEKAKKIYQGLSKHQI